MSVKNLCCLWAVWTVVALAVSIAAAGEGDRIEGQYAPDTLPDPLPAEVQSSPEDQASLPSESELLPGEIQYEPEWLETSSCEACLAGDDCFECSDCLWGEPLLCTSPYKGVFYENDFSYLEGAVRTEYFELFKMRDLGCCTWLDLGGEFRYQFKNENRRTLYQPWVPAQGRPTRPRTDTFNLTRTRLYADLKHNEWLRGYVEYIDAESFHENLPSLPIDQNRGDLLNAFGEMRLYTMHGATNTSIRVGRQELIYASERLISPYDWANTRRTFEGVKAFSRGPAWDVDLFWARPVLVDPIRFDSSDQSQWFGGVNATYKCFLHQTLHPYFLILREEDVIGPNRVGAGNPDNRTYTVGAELKGEMEDYLWDLEWAYQFGDSGDVNISAGMLTLGLGRRMSCLPMSPTAWLWYDFASGDDDPTDGTIHTFNQLFPASHEYLGYLDLVGRQNIHDLNFQLALQPHQSISFITWLHLFWLAEASDGLYNGDGVRSRFSPNAGAGTEVGQELDFIVNIDVVPGVDYQIGYSHLWSGDFMSNTGDDANAYLVYTQLSIKF